MPATSSLTGIPPVVDGSEMTTGFFNSRFDILQNNILSINSAVPDGAILSESTWAGIEVNVSSASSSYIRFRDSSNQRSTYHIGSFNTATADGLNIWDESGQTMIVSLSKQSVRFFQNVVGPVFNTSGDFVHAAVYGTASMSTESRVQAAIDDAASSGISYVLLPRTFLPYSAGSISFNSRIQMVREGGEWARYDLRAYGAAGNGTSDDRPAMHALANTAIPPEGGAMYLSGPAVYKLNSTVTIPTTVAFEPGQAALVNVASGFTLSIQGPLLAPVTQSVFTGAGDVRMGTASANQISPRWFGAVCDNVTDDTTAIQAAIDVAPAGSTIFFPPGTYVISAELTGGSDMVFDGIGATIRDNGTRFRSFLRFANQSNIIIRNLTFDMGFSRLAEYNDYPTLYNCAIDVLESSNLLVEGCSFLNLYTISINLHNCTGTVDISRNYLNSPAQTQDLFLQHINIQTHAATTRIERNNFDNDVPTLASGVCGIFASGTVAPIIIRGNRFNYCGRDNTGTHRLGTIDFYGNSTDLTIVDNSLLNNMAMALRLNAVARVEVANNTMSFSTTAEAGIQALTLNSSIDFVGSGQVGVQDVNIHHNRIIDEGTGRIGMYLGAYDYSTPLTNVKVHHNVYHGLGRAITVAGPWDNVSLDDNAMNGTDGSPELIILGLQAPEGLSVTTANGVTEANSAYRNLFIRRNRFELEPNTANTIGVSLDKTVAYTGTVGLIDISDNYLRCRTNNTAQAIALFTVSGSTQGHATIRRNYVDGYTTAFYIRQTGEITLEDNVARNIVTNEILDGTGITVLNRRGNRFSVGASSGQAVLVNGTVTVSTTEVRTGDSILLTRVVAGGTTAGILQVGTITNATSFVINSVDLSGTLSADDDSTVFWQIMH